MTTLTVVARNAACNGTVDLLDGGGTLVFETGTGVEVATCGLSVPAFGAATSGTATANAISSDTNATGGTVSQATFYDSQATPAPIWTVTVTATGGGGDIEMSSTSVGAGDTVSVSSYTHTQPA